MAPRLPQAVLFQVFDFLRDGRAFLQCEVVSKDFRDLLQDEHGIGRKLWEVRPIAYGSRRVFATGGTVEDAVRNELVYGMRDGAQSYTTSNDLEVLDGGRRVVLEFACLDAIAVEQRKDGPVILAEVQSAVWRRLVDNCFDRVREKPRARAPKRFYDVLLTNELVRVATDMLEGWFIKIIGKAVYLASHRDSTTLTFRDITLVGILTDDMTISSCYDVTPDDTFDFIISDRVVPELDSHGYVSGLGVEAHRIMRRLVRKTGGVAYEGGAYIFMWKILLFRLCNLLDRCAFFYMSRKNIEMKMVGGNPPDFMRGYWFQDPMEGGPENAVLLEPVLEDLLHVAKHSSGRDDAAADIDYVPGRVRDDGGDEDDCSFNSDDCSAEPYRSDGESSVGAEDD